MADKVLEQLRATRDVFSQEADARLKVMTDEIIAREIAQGTRISKELAVQKEVERAAAQASLVEVPNGGV